MLEDDFCEGFMIFFLLLPRRLRQYMNEPLNIYFNYLNMVLLKFGRVFKVECI